MKRIALISALVFLAVAAGTAYARSPQWGGLSSVAVSPDGKTLVVGGQSRTLYVVDAATLEVKNRIWTEARIGYLMFNKDGTKLVMETDEDCVRLYDVATWKPAGRADKATWVNAAQDADLMAALEDDWEKPKIHFMSMTTLVAAGSVTLKERVAAFALDAEGKKLAVLTEGKEEGEKKAEGDRPEELEGAAANEWDQKNDGQTCKLVVYEVPSGKELASFSLWYTSSGSGSTDLLVDASGVTVVNYYNVNAKINDKGEVTLFETKNSYNYGRGVSQDRKAFLCGGLRDATYTTVQGMAMTQFEIDQMAGWPEYFEFFTFAKDGSAYGVTSAFRLVKISKEGKVEKTAPVF